MNQPTHFAWSPDETLNLHSGPRSLATAGPGPAEIEVDESQIALLLVDHEVVGVLFPGRHHVPMQAVAVDEAEAPKPWPLENETDVAQMSPLPPDALILFLSTEPGPALHWGEGITTTLAHDESLVALEMEGRFQLRIADPVAFYDSFLRRSEDLADRELWPIAAVLIHDRFCQVLKSRTNSPEELRDAISRLGSWDAGDLGPFLPDLGLEIVQFSLDRAGELKPLESPLLEPQQV